MPPDGPPREIERKFLVDGDGWRGAVRRERKIRQAYLARTGAAQVRVRIVDGDEAKLTIKSADPERTRTEFEYDVPVEEARAMLDLATGAVIEKTRFVVPESGGREWEIDVFDHPLEGLVLAEIELDEEGEDIALPDWCGREVTGDARFYNAELAEAGSPPEIE